MLTTLFLCAALAPQSPPQTVADMLPFPATVGEASSQMPPPLGTLLTRDRDSHDLLNLNGEALQIPDNTLIDLLRTQQATAFEENRLAVRTLGDALLVMGETGEVATLRTNLAALQQALTRSLQIEIAVWDVGDGPAPAPVMSAAEFTAFAADRRPLWRGSEQTVHAAAVAINGMRWSRYVRSINAEVAQDAATTAPYLDDFGEGCAASVRAHELLGADEFAVHAQWCFGRHRGMRTASNGIPNTSDLDQPQLETNCGTCSGRIGNGGALAVTLRGEAATGGNVALTMRVTAKAPATPRSHGDTALLPVSALASTALTERCATPWLEVVPDSWRGLHFGAPASPSFGYVPSSDLLDIARSALGDDGDQIEVLEGVGGFLFVRGEPDRLARFVAALQMLQDRMVRTVTVRHTAKVDQGATVVELVAPTLAGRQLTLGRWFETTALARINISIAQKAQQHTPLVEPLFSGTLLQARVVPTGEACHLEFTCESELAPLPPPRSSQPFGSLMLASVASRHAAHDGIVRSGETVDLGDGPTRQDEGARRCQLAVSVGW